MVNIEKTMTCEQVVTEPNGVAHVCLASHRGSEYERTVDEYLSIDCTVSEARQMLGRTFLVTVKSVCDK